MKLFYRPAVSLHPKRRSPHFGWILPVSPLARIISLFLNNFQTLPTKNPCLKWFAILNLLCVLWLFSFKRSFWSEIQHSRVWEIITYFQTARRQDNNSIFLAILFWIKKSNDLSQWCAFLSIVKNNSSVCCKFV